LTGRIYETSPGRAVCAVVAGALVGGLSYLGERITPALLEPATWHLSWELGGQILLMTFAFASVGFGAGIVVAGIPAWIFLHRRGRRSGYDAALLGIVLTFVVTSLLQAAIYLDLAQSGNGTMVDYDGTDIAIKGRLTLHGWLSLVESALLMCVPGCLAAITLWRIAYRRMDAAPPG
jgi:hypothetical protein